MKAQRNGINVCFIDVVSHTTCLGLVYDNRLRCSTDAEHTCRPGGGGRWYLGQFQLSMCRWPLRAPTPLQSILWPIIDPTLVTFGQMCNFCNPNLVTLYLCMCLILNKEHFTFHLQYKHSGMFANCKYEELSYPKNQKMCDPNLGTLLKMRPHDNQSSRENATPSSGTSPLASLTDRHVYLESYTRNSTSTTISK